MNNKKIPDKTWDEATKEDIDIVVDKHVEEFSKQDFDADMMETMNHYIFEAKCIIDRGGVPDVFKDIGDKLDYYIVKRLEKMKPIYDKKADDYLKKK